jgi:hypothetical protein
LPAQGLQPPHFFLARQGLHPPHLDLARQGLHPPHFFLPPQGLQAAICTPGAALADAVGRTFMAPAPASVATLSAITVFLSMSQIPYLFRLVDFVPLVSRRTSIFVPNSHVFFSVPIVELRRNYCGRIVNQLQIYVMKDRENPAVRYIGSW